MLVPDPAPRGLVESSVARDARTPFTDTASADERVFAMVERQATWVAETVQRVDPQGWLFAERTRFLAEGRCDPWAEQLLRRAGVWPRTA